MKKTLLLFMVLLLVGCGSKSREEKFKDMAYDYFHDVYEENLESNLVEIKITLQHLNNYGVDTSDLNGCDADSFVTLKIGEVKNKRGITSSEVNLVCGVKHEDN